MTNKRLKEIRLFLGMTQKQFGDYFGISISVVGMIEAGQRDVSDNVAAKVTRGFTASDDFFEFLDNRKKLGQ